MELLRNSKTCWVECRCHDERLSESWHSYMRNTVKSKLQTFANVRRIAIWELGGVGTDGGHHFFSWVETTENKFQTIYNFWPTCSSPFNFLVVVLVVTASLRHSQCQSVHRKILPNSGERQKLRKTRSSSTSSSANTSRFKRMKTWVLNELLCHMFWRIVSMSSHHYSFTWTGTALERRDEGATRVSLQGSYLQTQSGVWGPLVLCTATVVKLVYSQSIFLLRRYRTLSSFPRLNSSTGLLDFFEPQKAVLFFPTTGQLTLYILEKVRPPQCRRIVRSNLRRYDR